MAVLLLRPLSSEHGELDVPSPPAAHEAPQPPEGAQVVEPGPRLLRQRVCGAREFEQQEGAAEEAQMRESKCEEEHDARDEEGAVCKPFQAVAWVLDSKKNPAGHAERVQHTSQLQRCANHSQSKTTPHACTLQRLI